MADEFNRKGVKAGVLTSDNGDKRTDLRQAL